MLTDPMPARGIGQSGSRMWGASQPAASRASSPPVESTTMWAPATAAAWAASTVSSVSPE